MDAITLGMDFNKLPFRTVITIRIGGRAYGKTFLTRLWMQYYYPELITRQLIRRLAAEAVINITINS